MKKFLLDGARETLVLLGIVILKTNLEFNGFQEIPLLIDRLGQKCVHSLIKSITRYFGPVIKMNIVNLKLFLHVPIC